MGPKTLKSQFTMRTVDVLVCDSLLGVSDMRGGEESNLFAWCKSDTNTIPQRRHRRRLIRTGNECTPSLGDGKTWYV